MLYSRAHILLLSLAIGLFSRFPVHIHASPHQVIHQGTSLAYSAVSPELQNSIGTTPALQFHDPRDRKSRIPNAKTSEFDLSKGVSTPLPKTTFSSPRLLQRVLALQNQEQRQLHRRGEHESVKEVKATCTGAGRARCNMCVCPKPNSHNSRCSKEFRLHKCQRSDWFFYKNYYAQDANDFCEAENGKGGGCTCEMYRWYPNAQELNTRHEQNLQFWYTLPENVGKTPLVQNELSESILPEGAGSVPAERKSILNYEVSILPTPKCSGTGILDVRDTTNYLATCKEGCKCEGALLVCDHSRLSKCPTLNLHDEDLMTRREKQAFFCAGAYNKIGREAVVDCSCIDRMEDPKTLPHYLDSVYQEGGSARLPLKKRIDVNQPGQHLSYKRSFGKKKQIDKRHNGIPEDFLKSRTEALQKWQATCTGSRRAECAACKCTYMRGTNDKYASREYRLTGCTSNPFFGEIRDVQYKIAANQFCEDFGRCTCPVRPRSEQFEALNSNHLRNQQLLLTLQENEVLSSTDPQQTLGDATDETSTPHCIGTGELTSRRFNFVNICTRSCKCYNGKLFCDHFTILRNSVWDMNDPDRRVSIDKQSVFCAGGYNNPLEQPVVECVCTAEGRALHVDQGY